MNNRTHMCGELNASLAEQSVVLKGWVQRSRNLGGIVFVWMRDRSGIVQLVFDGNRIDSALLEQAETLRSEYVIEVHGVVRMRDEGAINTKLKTGEIEIYASKLIVLNQAKTPPIYIENETKEQETVRLKYRYLDLRRPIMQDMLMFRHKLLKSIRDSLDLQGFVEVETPLLSKSTPEGARDFLVPARAKAGSFYALPQSPQIYKQLLMLSGLDRYYQIARCFRDEDGRADRQPEFTQCDMEMSFIDPEDIQGVVESVYQKLFSDLMNKEVSLPLKRLTWRDAMNRYGSDKPDTRFDMEISDVGEVVKGCGFQVFEKALEDGQTICAICAKGAGKLSRKEIDALGEFVKTYHVKGLAWAVKNADGTIRSSFAKAMQGDSMQKLMDSMQVEDGDALFVIADKKLVALTAMGQLRLRLGKQLDLIDNNRYDLLWVTEFPLLEWDEDNNRYVAMHHPFTNVMDEDIELMKTNPGEVRAKAYDLVMNGLEMGSGSIRIHTSDLQEKMFNLLGFSKEESWEQFGFLLGAFEYGTPPHGGFAFGIDRLCMVLADAESLRDVIAFPKIQNGNCLMMDTPSTVQDSQLEQLHLSIKSPS